jgi:peptidoglycan/xylan/chitin deacetylase (PgdA/CDA1 family)
VTTQAPRPRNSQRSALDSPWLAAALVVVVLALIGAVLLVPGLLGPTPGASPTSPSSTAGATPSPTPGEPTFARPTPSPAPSFTAYIVRSGDTLESIAKHFRTTARSIAWWNRGAYPTLDPESAAYNPNHLEIGWVLVVLPDSVVDENNPPSPSPGPSVAATDPGAAAADPGANPIADPTVAPTPKPSTATLATVIANGTRTSKTIALTFDMGGRLTPAVAIVQWLIDHDVHATLFPTGVSGTTTSAGLAAMELAATRPDLFDFGNHSWDHPDFRTLTPAQMATELTRTETALVPVVGATKPWFRPPFGDWNATVRAGVAAAGWKYLVMWDVDMIDWKLESDGGPTAAEMATKLTANARGGSIVLMHLGGYNTLAALPGILAACAGLGLQPVTLVTMFGL